jgi:hypothetical protein
VFDEILEAVRAAPGIEAASLTSTSPLGSGSFQVVMAADPGDPPDLAQTLHVVSPDYFRSLGTRIVEGRPFTNADRPGAPTAAIVDANLARALWPGASVAGRCLPLTRGGPCVWIVGISEPRRLGSLTEREGEVFHALAQEPGSVPQAVLARSTGDAADAAASVAAAIRRTVPALPLVEASPLEDMVDARARSWRLGALLFGVFAGIAVVLAAAGFYGLLAFAVRQRTAEIGVRIALGAVPRRIAGLVLFEGGRLVAVGWATGLAAAAGAAAWIRSLLFGVEPSDPLTLFVASGVLVAAGLAGCLLPALRAARVDPVVALRTE